MRAHPSASPLAALLAGVAAGRGRGHRRRPDASSRRRRAPGIDSVYAGEWEYMVGGGVATFDCNDDGFPDMLLAGGEAPAKFYRNASTRGGPLRFEAAAERARARRA